MKVSDILKVKGDILYTVAPDSSLHDAIDLMVNKDIGSLVVMQSGSLAGMLTFREIMKAVHRSGQTIANDKVSQHMETNVLCITPDSDINEIRRLMLEKHARYVPVMDGKLLMGVMSFYDLAKAVLEAQSFENKMLKAYIADWPEDGEE
jgi:CBS domain-containing protein